MNKSKKYAWMNQELVSSFLRIILLAVTVIVCLQLIDDGFSYLVDSDNALYILLTKALATGQGYVSIHLPGHPGVQYPPPLFPLLLSPLFSLFGYNFTLMRLVVIAFAIGSVFLITALFKRLDRGEEMAGLMIALLFITNHGILVFTKEVLPEIPYIFFTLLALYSAEAFKDRNDVLPYALYLPLVFALAYLTKNHGIFLCLAMVTVLTLKVFEKGGARGRRALQLTLFAAVTAPPLILWVLWVLTKARTPGSVYFYNILKNFYELGSAVLLERVWENLVMITVSIPGSLITFVDLEKFIPPAVFNILSLFLFFTVFTGLIYRLAFKRGVMEFYVVFYILIVALWSVYGLGDARRYMIALVPFLYYYSFTGFNLIFSVGELSKGLRPDGLKGPYILIPFLLFLFLNVAEIRGMLIPAKAAERVAHSAVLLKRDLFVPAEGLRPDAVLRGAFKETRPCYYDYMLSAHMLKRLSAPEDVIMTRKPELTSLITGSYAVKFPFTEDRKSILRFVEKNGVDFVLIDGCFMETRKYLLPFVNENRENFKAFRADGKDTGILSYGGR